MMIMLSVINGYEFPTTAVPQTRGAHRPHGFRSPESAIPTGLRRRRPRRATAHRGRHPPNPATWRPRRHRHAPVTRHPGRRVHRRACGIPQTRPPPRRPPFFDDWIAQLTALNGLSPAAAPSALRQALQHAPGHRRPSDEDTRLFATAGTSTVPYAAVIDWLKIRKMTDDVHGVACLTTRPPLVAGMATVDGDWATRCRTLAHTAARAGHGLPPVLVEVLAAQPPAAVAGICAAPR